MIKRLKIPKCVSEGSRAVHLLLAMALVIGLAATASLPTRVAPRLHPLVAQLAAEKPEQSVAVIVQKADASQAAEQLAEHLGGRVTKDLSIINAFVTELPAWAARELASSSLVRWVSLDAPVASTACTECIDTSRLVNTYIRTIRADSVWNKSPYLQGQGIGVAIVDSGINPQEDLISATGASRIAVSVAFNSGYNASPNDQYGHGNHVAGVIGGNGRRSKGAYIGVAPKVNLINVKVSDDLNHGAGTASTVVQGLQWILENKTQYNIRVVNLSLNSAVFESYHTSPIDAAVEILWFNGIVVVASAGNRGDGALYPPANDPFVITVGATDEKGTASLSDDVVALFSAYGTTSDGVKKPDLVAPGVNIVGLLGNTNSDMAIAHPDHVVGSAYFRMSGTSASAPMVAAAAALLLQDEPTLTPDQVKYRLTATANKAWSKYDSAKAGAGYLNVYGAVNGATTASANTGLQASQLLWTGSQPITWGSVNWNSVNWNSVNWNSVNWNSVNWNSVNWNSDYWGP